MPKTESQTSFRWLFILLGIVVVVWASFSLLVWLALDDWPRRGAFGDMFGAVNSLFAGLAFAGILFALHLQRQELIIQREELRAQREELQLTRSELARAAQAQENTQVTAAQQLDTMKIAAQLNALTSLIDSYALKIERTPDARLRDELYARRLEYVDQLDRLLEEINREHE